MFIRVKKVKKRSGKIYEYAHLVKGLWKRKKLVNIEGKRKFRQFNNSVHKYSKFLGRVYRFENKKELEFEEFFGGSFEGFVSTNKIEDIYKKLLEFELISRGFNYKNGIMFNCGLFIDLNRRCVHNGKDDVVIKIKEVGCYICNRNLEDLFEITKIKNRTDGIYLLKKLKSLGIDMTSERFYLIVDKLIREN